MKAEFVNGIPICPAVGCGSYEFDMTSELIGPGEWKVESIYCAQCNTKIEVTQELEKFLRGGNGKIRKASECV